MGVVARLLAPLFTVHLLPFYPAKPEYGPNLAGVGVVLMHGTLASPAQSTAKLAGLLRLAGAIVLQPRMAWSRSRIMDASWEQEIGEIDEAIAQVRAAGARWVVLAGHSRGGTATLAYAARRHRPDALVVLAPGPAGTAGQPPEFKADLADIVEEHARALLRTWRRAAGLAGVSRLLITTGFTSRAPHASGGYAGGSGFDAQTTAPRIPRVPVLWVNTALDLAIASQRIAASRIPKNPQSRYLELPDTFHEDVPDHSQRYVLSWLQGLRW
jgi:pimeloyl-ACP methyl ester carboxylesterase